MTPTRESLDPGLPSRRLPVPDFIRAGESWRVEAENGWIATREGICSSRGCYRTMAAVRERDGFGLCLVHIEANRLWIENGQLVCWVLRP